MDATRRRRRRRRRRKSFWIEGRSTTQNGVRARHSIKAWPIDPSSAQRRRREREEKKKPSFSRSKRRLSWPPPPPSSPPSLHLFYIMAPRTVYKNSSSSSWVSPPSSFIPTHTHTKQRDKRKPCFLLKEEKKTLLGHFDPPLPHRQNVIS